MKTKVKPKPLQPPQLVPRCDHTTMGFARESRWAAGSTHQVTIKPPNSEPEIQVWLRKTLFLLLSCSSCKTGDVSKHAIVCTNARRTADAHVVPVRKPKPPHSTEETQTRLSCQRTPEPRGPRAD